MGTIANKRQMYDLLSAGSFGNTVPAWFNIDRWEADPLAAPYNVWGVRTLTPGGPCYLYCPRREVRITAEAFQKQGHGVNISLMIDAVVNVTLMADVWDSPTGIRVYGVENPGRGANWRKVMPTLGRQYDGLSARMLLQRHLNPSSLADLESLFELYPDHVVELSACEQCIGTVPGRNGVIWEVRESSGRYERESWGNY